MTTDELKDLTEILTDDKPFSARPRALEYLKTVIVSEEVKEEASTRTSQQNKAIHKWFDDIAKLCQNEGVTMNLLIGHTHDVMVTKDAVKALWKALQEALFATESTTELKKTGQIEIMIDHFVALFAKEEIELPPFPNDADKQMENLSGVKLGQVANLKGGDYPEYTGPATI